jgi:hypothetical protein
MVHMMVLSRFLVIAAALLVAAPFPALAASLNAGPSQPSGTPDQSRTVWLPQNIPDHLAGVDEARAAHTWVSGYPLIKMGALKLYDGQGSEGGAEGRALELKFTGSHCKIYVDSSAKPYPSDNSISNTATEFDQKIWPNNTATFGNIIYNSIDINIINIDGPWGIGGYFTPASPNSVYMDCADINSWGFQIVAHEFEHLIHNQKDADEELWLNEGCADLAIAIIYGQDDGTITGHVDGFEQNPDNDLTVFQNQMYDYGSAYAFIQYFWDHFGGQSSIRDLVADKQNGITGIDDTLQSLGYQKRFDVIFPEWCVANRINNRTLDEGQYGYDKLVIQVATARDWASPPASYSSDVHRWASDCYRIQSGNGLDLLTEFCGTKGSYMPRIFARGLNGLNSTVRSILLDAAGNGSNLLYGFGSDYSDAVLFTPSSNGGNYAVSFRMVDRSPPNTTALVIPSAPNGMSGWYTVTPKVTLRPSEAGTTFFWWDATPELNYTDTIEAPEGNRTLFFYTIDSAQNREQVRSLALAVDTVLPRTNATITPPGPDGNSGWYLQVPLVELESEEGAETFYVWDRGETQNYTGTLTVPEGKHMLEYFSVDEAGNKGNVSQQYFMVDSSAPMAWANITPAGPDGLGGWYRSAPQIELTTDEPDARLLFVWDNGSEMTYLRPINAPEGLHRFYYRARDSAGNNGTLLQLTIRVDSGAPSVTLTAEPRSPDAKNGWYRTRPTITLQVSDADPAASAFFSWDGADFRAYAGPFKPPEGTHTLTYYTSDTRGNRGNESSRVFKVDSSAPVTIISIDPPGMGEEWYLQRPQISLSNSEMADIFFWWDGGEPQLYGGPVMAPEGEHEMGFQSRDAAGNTEKARSAIFRVDTNPPEAILSVTNTSLILGDILGADASSSLDTNGIEAYSIDFGDGYRKTGATKSWDHQYDAPGTYSIVLKVRDVSGQWSEPVSTNVTVSLPPRPPASPSESGTGPSQSTILAAAAAILVVGIVSAAILRRRRGEP